MLKEELKSNALRVSEIIRDDEFPLAVTPFFLRGAVMDYPLRGGKHLRSALLNWSCGLLGGNIETAKFAAAAVEIYHNWTLVHDDIIDNDIMRRNKPSTHVDLANFAEKCYQTDKDKSNKFGRDFAILTGDVQQGWAANMLMKSGSSISPRSNAKSFAEKYSGIVVTNDRELRKRLKDISIKVIYLRNKRHLVLDP